MPAFKKYPTAAEANRKQRKSQRKNIFAHNSSAFAEARRARKKVRKEAAEKLAKEQEAAEKLAREEQELKELEAAEQLAKEQGSGT